MKNVLLLIFSISMLCTLQQPLMAKDEPSPEKAKPDTEKIAKEIPSAITLGIVDGIIRYVKDDRRVKIRLQWDPMPLTLSLINRTNESEFEVTKLDINNEDIQSGNWTRNISNEKLEKLRVALNISDLKALSLQGSLQDLDPGLKISDYVRMQRERNILKILLLSKGVKYSFGFKTKENPIVSPDFLDKDIKWQINIYSFKNKNKPPFYRFTAKAIVEPFEKKIFEDNIELSEDKKEKVSYDVRFKLNESDQISSIANNLFLLSNKDSSLGLPSAPTDNEKKALGTETTEKAVTTALTSLSGFFSFLGSSDQFGTAIQGILGGTDNTSIVSGGLIGFKNGGVSPLIGINQDIGQLGDDISGGFLFGVGLGEKTSLFLGPSIRSSLFTLSAGATLGTEANSEVNFGGMIAIDLSRLTNSKKDTPPIKVSGSSQGGGLDRIADSMVEKYTVIEYTSDREVSMTRICDENSILIPVENRKTSVNINQLNKRTRQYVIRGFYEYKSIDGKNIYYPNITNDKLTKIEILSNGKGAKEIPCISAKADTTDKPVK